MCAFSIGTGTDGSIMFPANHNVVVGVKPTLGQTSTLGVIPEAPSMDTVRPFGRSVEDATTILDIIADRTTSFNSYIDDWKPSHEQDTPAQPHASWVANKDALKGARFGLPWKRVWETASKNMRSKFAYTVPKELTKI